MFDEFIDVFLFELDGEKDLFHDLCVHERGIKSITALLCVTITTTHDAHGNDVLFALLSSQFESLADRSDFGGDTLDLLPVFSPPFVILLVATEDRNRIHLRQFVYTRYHLLTKSFRNDHADFFVSDIF